MRALQYANGAFIGNVSKNYRDYFSERGLSRRSVCDGLCFALNSEEKAGKLRERIDTLICVCFGKDKVCSGKRAAALYLPL